MRADVVVRNIGELVTFAGGPLRRPRLENAGIIRGALVAYKGGRVAWVGPEADAPGIEAETVVDAEGLLATPAFVDSHTHLVFAGERYRELWMKLEGRSYLEILSAGGGIYYTVEQTRRASSEELYRLARERLALMMGLGTGVVEAKTGYGLLPGEELRLLEALARLAGETGRVVPTLLALVVPREYDDRSAYVRDFASIVPEAARMGARFVDVFCDRGAFTVEETRLILEAARRAGLPARLHSDELANIGCHRLALEYEVYSLDHLEHLPPEAAESLARTRVVATLLPTSMLSVFSEKKPPVDALRRAGVYLGLATDYNPNNMNPSMQSAIELAIYLLRLTPIEALAAATVNAAHSLGLTGEHGTIRPGARSDLIIWGIDSVEKLGYHWGRPLIRTTITPRGPLPAGARG